MVPLIFQKYRSHLKIQGAKKGDMKQFFFYIEDRQILGATLQGEWDFCSPDFMFYLFGVYWLQPWLYSIECCDEYWIMCWK